MAPSAEVAADLSHLPQTDGSATYSQSGYTITASVNGPIEAQRRDENAFEAIVDVIVRPAAGVGGTAERHLESVLQAALRQLIPVRNYPRTMIQVTLQVVETPENAYANSKVVQAQQNLPIMPALLHASVLGLLAGAVPMKTIATATFLAIGAEDQAGLIMDPNPAEVLRSKSVHILGYTSDDELLLAESEGSFSVDEWKNVLQAGERICCQGRRLGEDATMGGVEQESQSIRDFVRSVMETKTARDLHWK